MNETLPKTAIRILGRPGIDSLQKPDDDVYWRCWAADGWTDDEGSDGIRETSLGAIESWAKGLKGPADADRRLSVREILEKGVAGYPLSDNDLEVLRAYLAHFANRRFHLGFPSSRMDAADGFALDDSLAAQYGIPAEELSVPNLEAAIADQSTDEQQHREFLAAFEEQESINEGLLE